MKTLTVEELCKSIIDCPHSTPIWKDSGIRVIRNFNIKKGQLDFSDGYFVDEETYSERTKRALPESDDLVISREAPMGEVCIIPKNLKCCLGQRLVLLKVNKEKCFPKYLLYMMQSKYVQEQIGIINKTGSIVSNLNIPDLKALKIPYRPIESQQKIAAVLSTLDDKIALNRRMNAKLEQMAKRLYDHWFVQFDFSNADGKPYKASGGKMVWNETLKREIPEGWEVKKLGELFTTNRGVSYSTKTITGNAGIPMINLASFSPDGSYKVDGIKLYTGEYTQEKVLKPFDLVMCNTQQTAIDFSKDIIGKTLLVPDIFEGDITSSHHVNTLKVHDEKLKFYLYRLFNTDYFHAYISHFASGTNIMGLDFAGVENYTAVIPGDAILSQFADFTLNIEKKKSEIIRENTKLIALRDHLLPLLMNGQVNIME